MSWAKRQIEELQAGRITQVRPHGGSMRGRIESGQRVTLDPTREPAIGDAVLCRCGGTVYLHLIKAVRGGEDNRRFLIGNNRGGENGWVSRAAIYGVATHVED